MRNNNLGSVLEAHRPVLLSAMMGVVCGINNITGALAMGALIFVGPLAPGMGLGIGVVLFGGAILALVIALRSTLPNSVALVQRTTVAILAAAILLMAAKFNADTNAKIATAIAIMGASAFITGVLFWLTGFLKLGGLIRFFPYPVVAGFLAGSGWLLINGALVILTNHNIDSTVF